MASFKEQSYSRHAAEFKTHATHGELASKGHNWLRADTVDAWRHERMYSTLEPLLVSDRGARWITVGDGRFGKDARRLQSAGATVVATDIAGDLLVEARDAGVIERISVENAECLSFADEEFDYAYCKEAYHHFPRPWVALHEMIRVARKAVVLTEPLDRDIPRSLRTWTIRRLVLALRRLRGIGEGLGEYETSGNYIYRISVRELQKVALGLNLPAIAYLPFNDAYIAGVEDEMVTTSGPLFRRVRAQVRLKDFLCKVGVMEYGLATAMVFKVNPPPATRDALLARGYIFQALPRNPYAAVAD